MGKRNKCTEESLCFSNNPLFSLLNKEEIEALNKTCVQVSFKKGEIIYKQGMPLSHLVIVHSGFGRLFIEGSTGKNLILRYTSPFDVNGGIGIFIDQIHHSTLMACSDCETCLIDINSFLDIGRNNRAFMDAYLKSFSERILQTYVHFATLTQKNMEARMADAILYLKGCVAEKDGCIDHISKADLAELTAMSRESGIRVLKDFKDEGYINIDGHKISIIDEVNLRNIAQFG